jgi:hypothetical protein
MFTRFGFKLARFLVGFGLISFVGSIIYSWVMIAYPQLPMINPSKLIRDGFLMTASGVTLGVLCEISDKLSKELTHEN